MDDAKQQLIDKLTSANNILVTVSRDPSVDQLASCIGLTLLLNKQGKHAAAVFSGKVPSTLEFLQPEETLEKNTDSLRDFIISLDKAKADKLRYKVEEDVVRIFITPYKTSLSEDDLEFSEGDFNVDVVVALGVQKQEDLDQAITAHGRILHGATVTSINTSENGGLGTINWQDPQASSLSELVADLSEAIGSDLLDEQIATALMTGIVSETGRFSNDKTSSQTMSASALLLSAGANQQLVASKLEEKPGPGTGKNKNQPAEAEAGDDGTLSIDHTAEEPAEPADTQAAPEQASPPDAPAADAPEPAPPAPEPAKPEAPASNLSPGAKLVTDPPELGGTLTANSQAEKLDPVTDPMSLPATDAPVLLEHKGKTSEPATPPAAPPAAPPPAAAPMTPPPPAWTPPASPASSPPPKIDDKSKLSDIEKSVTSPHSATLSELEAVRGEINKALSGSESNEPIEGLNAQPFGGDLHDAKAPSPPADPASAEPPSDDDTGDGTPPPVPPPIPFQFGNSAPPS